MRDTYNHEVSKDIVLSRPKMIVVEDLAVRNLIKNRHLSKAIQDCAFYDLLSKIIQGRASGDRSRCSKPLLSFFKEMP